MIVLIGAPGAGKSSVGRRVAEARGWPFIDVNDELRARLGDLDDAFVELGSDRFRAVEREVSLAALAAGGATVVSLTSGAGADDEVRAALSGATVVWLRVDAPTLMRRKGMTAHAPVGFLQLRSTLVRQVRERDQCYAALADIVVDTSQITVAEASAAVEASLPRG